MGGEGGKGGTVKYFHSLHPRELALTEVRVTAVRVTSLMYSLGPEHFDELVSLVKENCLFKDALKLYGKSSQEHRVSR